MNLFSEEMKFYPGGVLILSALGIYAPAPMVTMLRHELSGYNNNDSKIARDSMGCVVCGK